MVSKYSKSELDILKRYVDSNDLEDDSEYHVIKRMVLSNPSVTMTVYRGHNGTRTINNDVEWFSTTSDKKVAITKFMNHDKHCCLFTIHLIDVPALFVNKSGILTSLKDRASEYEVIVLGGGTFFANSQFTQEGFDDIMDGEYECWYTFPGKSMTINRTSELFTKLDPDDYEFIDNKEDVKIFLEKYNISETEAKDVFELIKQFKTGGRNRPGRNRPKRNKKRKSYKRKKSLKRRSRALVRI